MTDYSADSILVLLETTPAGELAKSTAGLLGAASLIGTPVALVVTGGGGGGQAQALAEQAAAAGAERVLAVETDATQAQLTVPTVDALAAAAA
ncbi:MAG TPA: electron transfer flavoprotein subunit alpha/FixB family protein, partial [Agromyces sp.]|nr:electron transfer flavoprotein subunit alpha/FixB family protein [Agromyces sp.]